MTTKPATVFRLNQEDLLKYNFFIARAYNPQQSQHSERNAWLVAHVQELFALSVAVATAPMEASANDQVTVSLPVNTVLKMGTLLEQYKLFFGEIPNE